MAQARGEAKTQQMAKRKNVIGESGGVGEVFLNPKIRFGYSKPSRTWVASRALAASH
jgi:hypothetical protein